MLCQTLRDVNKTIIIGLTGRTGSGCTTVANILSSQNFSDLKLRDEGKIACKDTDSRKSRILYNYFGGQDAVGWTSFKVIKLSAVILQIIMENGLDGLVDCIKHVEKWNLRIDNCEKLISQLEGLRLEFDKAIENRKNLEELVAKSIYKPNDYEILKRLEKYYLLVMPKFQKELEDIMCSYTCHTIRFSKDEGDTWERNDLFKVLLQYVGNNIRSSGNPYEVKFDSSNQYLSMTLELLINCIILCDREQGRSTRICIDAIRNPFESLYLKQNYANYYLVAVHTEESKRIERLELQNFKMEEIHSLDNIECPKHLNGQELFYHQDVKGCIEKADIHIDNSPKEDEKFYLTKQLIKYVALMNHPGLVTPTHVERCMQIAYNARLNSGCLSRQVGAVITDQNYSVKAVGWNDVAEGQVSCALRDLCDYKNRDRESFSEYELQNNEFQEVVDKLYIMKQKKPREGLPLPYCFKDIKMGLDNQRNQVHTRSLHAEENAFLQITKYGGQGIQGGKLFVTASPCELCSKKSYQLGIKQIYYIDPYPGIAKEHILSFGKVGNPELILYTGAIGAAFEKLYSPVIPMKDELELHTKINDKNIASNLHVDERIADNAKYIEYTSTGIHMIFHTLTQIDCIRETTFVIKDDSVEKLHFGFKWTGNAIGEITALGSNCEVCNYQILGGSGIYEVRLRGDYKEGDVVTIKIKISLKDDMRKMYPHLSTKISNPMKKLTLKLSVADNAFSAENVVLKKYYDWTGNKTLGEPVVIEGDNKDGYYVYSYETKDDEIPIVKYTYALEWEVIKK